MVVMVKVNRERGMLGSRVGMGVGVGVGVRREPRSERDYQEEFGAVEDWVMRFCMLHSRCRWPQAMHGI